MEFEWDEEKDAANRAKHGVSLAEAALLDWASAYDRFDSRNDYGETRIRSLVPLQKRVYLCVYTVRGRAYRIISLRKANLREVREYENARARI